MPTTYSSTILSVASLIRSTNVTPTPSEVQYAYMNAQRVVVLERIRSDSPVYPTTKLQSARALLDQFIQATRDQPANAAAAAGWSQMNNALRAYDMALADYRTMTGGVFAAPFPEALMSKWRAFCAAYITAWRAVTPLATAVYLTTVNITAPIPNWNTPTSPVAPTAITSSPSADTLGVPNLTDASAAIQAGVMSAQRATSPTLIGPGTLDTSPASAPTQAVAATVSTMEAGTTPALQLNPAQQLAPPAARRKVTEQAWFWPVTLGGGALVLALLFRKKKGA